MVKRKKILFIRERIASVVTVNQVSGYKNCWFSKILLCVCVLTRFPIMNNVCELCLQGTSQQFETILSVARIYLFT